MNDDPIVGLWPVAMSVLSLFASGIFWAIRAASKKREAADADEIEFERTMIRALEGPGGAAAPMAAATPQHSISTAPAANAGRPAAFIGDILGSALAASAVAPPHAPQAQKAASDPRLPGAPPPSPFIESVIFKLSAAGLLENSDGALRCADPSLTGRILMLGRGRTFCVVDSPGALENPALAPFLQHYEGAILPGPGGQPVLVKRFETVISDAFKI